MHRGIVSRLGAPNSRKLIQWYFSFLIGPSEKPQQAYKSEKSTEKETTTEDKGDKTGVSEKEK